MGELVRFDDSAWPLLIVVLPAMMNSKVAVENVIEGYEAVLTKGQRFAHVVDCSAVAKFPGAVERKVLTDWVGDEARMEKERRLTVATGMVLTSGPMRAFVSAVNWVRRPPTPQIWTATQAEAVEWCLARLAEAGVSIHGARSTLRAENDRRDREARRLLDPGQPRRSRP